MRLKVRWISCLMVLMGAVPVLATTFVSRPFPDTVQDAPNIVRGVVRGTYTDWAQGEDGTRRIYTFFELQTTEVFKGSADPKSLTMREMGGEKDGIGMNVAGSAHFSRGEDVVVFLGPKNSEGSHDIWGMMMGKFNIERNAEGKEYLVGAAMTEAQGHDDSVADTQWTLEALRHLVKTQSDGNSQVNSGKTTANPQVIQGVASGASARPGPQPSLDEAAFQLQPSTSEESVALFWGLGVIGSLLVLIWFMRKGRKP